MCKLAKLHFACQHISGPQILLCQPAIGNAGQRCGNINGALENVSQPELCPSCVARRQTQQHSQVLPQATAQQDDEDSSSGEDSDESASASESDDESDEDEDDDDEEEEEEEEEESEVSSFAGVRAPTNRRFADVNTPATIVEGSELSSEHGGPATSQGQQGFVSTPSVARQGHSVPLGGGGAQGSQGFQPMNVPIGLQAPSQGQVPQHQSQGMGTRGESASTGTQSTGIKTPCSPFQSQAQQQQQWRPQVPDPNSTMSDKPSAGNQTEKQAFQMPFTPGNAQAQQPYPTFSTPTAANPPYSQPQEQGLPQCNVSRPQPQCSFPQAKRSDLHAKSQEVPLAKSEKLSTASHASSRKANEAPDVETELARLQLEATKLEEEQANTDLQRAIALSLADDEQRSLNEAISASMGDVLAWEKRAEEEVRVAALKDYVDGLKRKSEARRHHASSSSIPSHGKAKAKAATNPLSSKFNGPSTASSSAAASTIRPIHTATSNLGPIPSSAGPALSQSSAPSRPFSQSQRSPSPPISVRTASRQRSEEESRRRDRFNQKKEEFVQAFGPIPDEDEDE